LPSGFSMLQSESELADRSARLNRMPVLPRQRLGTLSASDRSAVLSHDALHLCSEACKSTGRQKCGRGAARIRFLPVGYIVDLVVWAPSP
jgi:hypothetical protein